MNPIDLELQERNDTVAKAVARRLVIELRRAAKHAYAYGEERWAREIETALCQAVELSGSLGGTLWLDGMREVQMTKREDGGIVISRRTREEPHHTRPELENLFWRAAMQGFSVLAAWRARPRRV
jgi:hypothetical protein